MEEVVENVFDEGVEILDENESDEMRIKCEKKPEKKQNCVGDCEKSKDRKVKGIKIRWRDVNTEIHFDIDGQPLRFWNTFIVTTEIIWVVVLVSVVVVCGTFNTILFKLQDESISKGIGNLPSRKFEHPFTQGIMNLLGKLIVCLSFHYITKIMKRFIIITKARCRCCNKKKEKKKEIEEEEDEQKTDHSQKKEINSLMFIIPSFIDVIASASLYVSLIFTNASVYQMLRGCNLLFTAVLSVLFLKSDIYKYPHKWVGIIFILFGVGSVGFSSIYRNNKGSSSFIPKNPFFGAIMVLVGELFRSIQLIFEELFLKGYKTDPLLVPGMEGFWGIPMQIVLLFILFFIPGEDFGSIESFPAALIQMINNRDLLLFVILLLVNIGTYNFAANWVTKELSAVHRVTIDCLRNVNVWIFQLSRGRETFSIVQLIGFVIMVSGTLLYNEIGFNFLCPCYLKIMKKWGKVNIRKALWFICCFPFFLQRKKKLIVEEENIEEENIELEDTIFGENGDVVKDKEGREREEVKEEEEGEAFVEMIEVERKEEVDVLDDVEMDGSLEMKKEGII